MSSFLSATFSLFVLFVLFVLCLIRLIHLDHTHTRPHHFHNLKHLIRPRHVHAHTQIRAFAVHDRQDPPRGRVGVQSDARGICLERRWVRHLVHVVGWGESVGKKSWRLGKWMRTSSWTSVTHQRDQICVTSIVAFHKVCQLYMQNYP